MIIIIVIIEFKKFHKLFHTNKLCSWAQSVLVQTSASPCWRSRRRKWRDSSTPATATTRGRQLHRWWRSSRSFTTWTACASRWGGPRARRHAAYTLCRWRPHLYAFHLPFTAWRRNCIWVNKWCLILFSLKHFSGSLLYGFHLPFTAWRQNCIWVNKFCQILFSLQNLCNVIFYLNTVI